MMKLKQFAVIFFLVALFLFCSSGHSFASKIKLGLYNGDGTGTPQFSSTQTVAPWFADTPAKELVHMKLGIKTDTGSVTISSFQVTMTFDKDYFEVTDANGVKINSITGFSPYFPVATGNPCVDVLNSVDYTTGTITYVAWVPAQGLCYADGAAALTATSSAPAFVMDFYLKPLKGSNGVKKAVKINDASDSTFVNDSNDITYSKDDATYTLLLETNHGTTGYQFTIKPIPPTLAAPAATNTKVTLTWTSNDTTGAKYNVYRAQTTTSGAAEPTSYTLLTAGTGLTVLTFDDTTIKWDSQFKKYWYKVSVKDTATPSPIESCAPTALKECVAQGIVDTVVPTIQSFDATSTVFDKAQITATLDEPGAIKANYSCPSCVTPVNNQETAYGALNTSGKPTVALPAFAAADEGKTVTFKIKAKDAAGNETAAFSAEKTFAITTCKETSPPAITGAPTSSISCPSDVVVSWDTGANASDSTIYYTNTSGFSDLKTEFGKGTAGVFKCNDPAYVKSPTMHILSVPSCGGNPALSAGVPYFYQVCSSNCFGENCSVSSNPFTLNTALNVTHTCATANATPGQAYPLTETFTGGCAPVTANIYYDTSTATLSTATSTAVPMTLSGSSFSESVPSTFITSALASFAYFIVTQDSTGQSVTKAPAGCTVNVSSVSTCGTLTASCTAASAVKATNATVNLTISGGSKPYSCDLYFGTTNTNVNQKVNTSSQSVNSDPGSYMDTIPAAQIPTPGTYFFKNSCKDSCAQGAQTAESTVCNLTVSDVAATVSTVSGTIKASDTQAALSGATVKLFDSQTSQQVGVGNTGSDFTTGADGTYRFEQVTVKLGNAYHVTATATGYGTKSSSDFAVPVGGANVDITLDKTTKISGKCTDSKTSTGVPSMKVKAVNSTTGLPSTAVTSATGDYSIESLTSGTYTLDVDVTGTRYKKPATQNITVPPDGTANFTLEPSPIVSVVIAPSTRSMGFGEQTAFWVDKVLTGSGSSLPKAPVEWDTTGLAALGDVSYSDGNKSILIFKSASKEGTATVTVTKVGGETVPANSVTTGTLSVTQSLVVREIKLFSPTLSGTSTAPTSFMRKPLTKEDGFVIIQSDVTHNNVSVTYRIYSLQGKLVKVLNADPVNQQANWDCTDQNGAQLPNGIYIIQAEAREGGQSALPGKPKAMTCMW